MTKKEAITRAIKILQEAFPKGKSFHYKLIGSIVVALSPSDAQVHSTVQQTIYTITMELNRHPSLFKRTRRGFYSLAGAE